MGNIGRSPNAEEYIANLRAQLTENSECGTTHYNLAVALMGQQEYDKAEQALHDAVDCSPNLAEAYVQLGGIALQRGDLEGCLDWNKRSIHARAGFAEGHANVGFVHMQMGNVEEAIPSLEKAIRWNPKFLQAYATLANAYLMQGQIDESIKTNRLRAITSRTWEAASPPSRARPARVHRAAVCRAVPCRNRMMISRSKTR